MPAPSPLILPVHSPVWMLITLPTGTCTCMHIIYTYMYYVYTITVYGVININGDVSEYDSALPELFP